MSYISNLWKLLISMAENVPKTMSHKEAQASMKELLIDLVKGRPFLYNKAHRDHYRKNKKDEAWDEISKILDVPGEYCFLFHGSTKCFKMLCFVN